MKYCLFSIFGFVLTIFVLVDSSAKVSKFDQGFLNEHIDEIKKSIREAEVIFIGEIVEMGEPPKYRTSKAPAFQTVTYKVKDVLKGIFPSGNEGRVEIDHLILAGSRNVTEAAGQLKLSPEIYDKGKIWIVMVKRYGLTNERWRDTDPDFGSMPETEGNVSALKELIEKR